MRKLIHNSGRRYLIAYLIPLFILLSITVKPVMTMAFGEKIKIKTMQYDPRDIFRGDYINLDYEISEIPLEKLDKEIIDLKSKNEIYDVFYQLRNRDLYIVLEKSGEYYEVDQVTTQKPKGGIFLIGRYEYPIYNGTVAIKENGEPEIKGIKVQYSLDKYYIPENSGKELEQKALEGDLMAVIKVYRGYSLLQDVE